MNRPGQSGDRVGGQRRQAGRRTKPPDTLAGRAAAVYVPEHCVWELTRRCNLRCLHCGSAAGTAREAELTVAECLDVAGDLLALGCTNVTLIGGEVFLYPGWQHVARRLSDGGAAVRIITNGYRFGKREIAEIKAAGLALVGLSIDGVEEHHDRIRRRRGSFARVLSALDRLVAEDIPVGVVSSLLELNVGDLEPLRALFAERGVTLWQLQIGTPMGNLAEQRDLALNPARIPDVTAFVRDARQRSPPWVYAGDNIGYFDENELYIRGMPGTLTVWSGCQAGLRVIGLDSAGNVRGCESLCSESFIEGNVRREPLAAIWNRPGAFAYNRAFDPCQLAGRCRDCERGPVCRGGCRGSCFFNSGGLFENRYCCYNPMAD